MGVIEVFNPVFARLGEFFAPKTSIAKDISE